MNICKTCKNFTKSGVCLYFRLKITDIINECDNYISSEQVATSEIPKIEIQKQERSMWKRGDFCFLPHYCGCPCHGLIPLKKEFINNYESTGYPQYIVFHCGKDQKIKQKISNSAIGRKRPDLSIINSKKIGSLNPMSGKDSWNKGTKGICKPNSGSFKKGQSPWNKKKEEISVKTTKNPEIIAEIKAPEPIKLEIKHILFEDQLKIALKRIEESRKNRVVEPEKVIKHKEDTSYANRINGLIGENKEPEEIEEPKNIKIRSPNSWISCVIEGKKIEYKKCKKNCKFFPC